VSEADLQGKSVNSKAKVAGLFLVAFLLFTLGFYRNQWMAAGKKWFYDWKRPNEVMLIARLVWSRQEGVFSDAALFGIGDGEWPLTQELSDHQYETYLNKGAFNEYWTYDSMPGLQGIIFGLIDKFTDFDPAVNLKLFRGLTSLASAAVFALIVGWLYLEFGFLPAVFTLVSIMISEWLTLYGGSIFFQLWAFYIPMLVVTAYLYMIKDEMKLRHGLLASISILAVLIKCLFNGFEFITPALAMMAVPAVYYALIREWRLKAFIAVMANLVISAFAGTLISLGILSMQIASVTGGFGQAFHYLVFTFGKRSMGDPAQYSGNIVNSLNASVWSVIWKYVSEGRAINFGNIIHSSNEWIQSHLDIYFIQLFILFIFFSLLFLLASFWRKGSVLYSKTLALLYTMWFSVLPPFSWLVIFKAHAYIHGQLDYIVWQMPFTLFGFALCGMTIRYIFALGSRN
jgi:hypothetical protein